MVEQLQTYDSILEQSQVYNQNFLNKTVQNRSRLLNSFKQLANATT